MLWFTDHIISMICMCILMCCFDSLITSYQWFVCAFYCVVLIHWSDHINDLYVYSNVLFWFTNHVISMIRMCILMCCFDSLITSYQWFVCVFLFVVLIHYSHHINDLYVYSNVLFWFTDHIISMICMCILLCCFDSLITSHQWFVCAFYCVVLIH